MKAFVALFLMMGFACVAQASWYWPFGSDEGTTRSEPRLSELMEPASQLIDEAADFAADGKIDESVAKYREALQKLEEIELENPERAKGAEFASLRNKRAYVNAAIDSLLLTQVKENARPVAVSDTTELERKLAEERAGKKKASKVSEKRSVKPTSDKSDEDVASPPPEQPKAERPKAKAEAKPAKPLTKREQAMADIAAGDFAAAELLINEMLEQKPNGAMALNLKAVMEIRQGKAKEAEQTLDQAIASNPRSHFAYYNMAYLMVQKGPEYKKTARRYYETGRAVGGPADEQLEVLTK